MLYCGEPAFFWSKGALAECGLSLDQFRLQFAITVDIWPNSQIFSEILKLYNCWESTRLDRGECSLKNQELPMRHVIGAILICLGTMTSCLAQDPQPPSSITPEQREAVSDKKAAEVRAIAQQARKKQDVSDASYRALMARWSIAVCLGCEDVPRRVRLLHTYPLRVLAGIPATEDDARERRGRVPL